MQGMSRWGTVFTTHFLAEYIPTSYGVTHNGCPKPRRGMELVMMRTKVDRGMVCLAVDGHPFERCFLYV